MYKLTAFIQNLQLRLTNVIEARGINEFTHLLNLS